MARYGWSDCMFEQPLLNFYVWVLGEHIFWQADVKINDKKRSRPKSLRKNFKFIYYNYKIQQYQETIPNLKKLKKIKNLPNVPMQPQTLTQTQKKIIKIILIIKVKKNKIMIRTQANEQSLARSHKKSRRLKSQQLFKQINSSPTNCSVSKQTHSFSKSPRFPAIKVQCPHVTYNGQEVKSRRGGVGIGVGKKWDIAFDGKNVPGVQKYNIRSKFQINMSLGKGCTIGKGRNEVRFNSYVNKQLAKTPASDRYQDRSLVNRAKSPLFSMGSRTKIHNKSLTIEPLNDNPGPGQYQSIQSIKFSRVEGSIQGNLNFSLDKSKRFPNFNNRIPGPATYSDSSSLSKLGKYSNSKHRRQLLTKFGTSKRITQFDQAVKKSMQIPGAGSYRAPSEFGNYEQMPNNIKLSNLGLNSIRLQNSPSHIKH